MNGEQTCKRTKSFSTAGCINETIGNQTASKRQKVRLWLLVTNRSISFNNFKLIKQGDAAGFVEVETPTLFRRTPGVSILCIETHSKHSFICANNFRHIKAKNNSLVTFYIRNKCTDLFMGSIY